MFVKKLEDKILQNGGAVIEVNSLNYKASQYNHLTKEAIKPSLSDRVKLIGGQLVQRDLYSSFLLYSILDENTINFNKCKRNFKKFLKQQDIVINKIKKEGDKTKNFGLSSFIA